MSADLQSPIFTDHTAARLALEAVRWPDGPICPHCGNYEQGTMPLVDGPKMSARPGLRYCNACKGQFTVTVGTVFERSKIPLTKWWLAVHLLGASKKGISSHQLHRMLGVTYKTAWFMSHRIREAMKDMGGGPLGGEGKMVEADETYIGNAKGAKPTDTFISGQGWVKRGGGAQAKYKIVSLIERGGRARSVKVDDITANQVREVLVTNADRKSKLMTDKSNVYTKVGTEYAGHYTVNHSDYEWARGPYHTNTIEGFFSIFKRGMKGVYQHCSEKHLHRYLAEFDFRYNHRVRLGWTDAERADAVMGGIEGKRLTYRRPSGAKAASQTLDG